MRKELVHQLRRNSNRMGLLILLAFLLSAASALVLWRHHRHALRVQNNEEIQTRLGLLELRVNQHRTTVLDWAHWDSMLVFATGRDPGFVERELAPSSIVRDGQVLIALDRGGRRLTLRSALGRPLDPGLLACLQQRLQVLQRRTATARPNDSFGLFCRVGAEVVIGAGTGIRASSGQPPDQGWLVHFGWLERPSYNQGLNRTFRQINRFLAAPGTASRGTAQPVAAISELMPHGEPYLLRPSLTPLEVARRAALLAIPAWLAINLVLAALLAAGLLLARQRRLTGRLRAWQEWQGERRRRHRISSLLMSRRHLLLAFTSDPRPLHESWIAAIRLENTASLGGGVEQATLQERSFQRLVLALSSELRPQVMGLMEPEILLLAFPRGAWTAATIVQTLMAIIQPLSRPATPAAWAGCCCVAPLQPSGQLQQVLNLVLELSREPAGPPIRFLPEGVSDRPPFLEVSSGAEADSDALSLVDGLVQLEPVLQWLAAGPRLLYNVVRFDPDAATAQTRSAPASRDPQNPALDLYLLRQAKALLQSPAAGAACSDLGVQLSRVSLVDPPAFQAVLTALQGFADDQRRRLVLELAETALMALADQVAERLRLLQQFGVRIAVTDFGAGHVPIQPLLALRPAFLKLSADYTRQLRDENIDGMVDFLLSYCRYKHCAFILQGIESRQQLQYWLAKGVTVFQGRFLDAPIPLDPLMTGDGGRDRRR